MKLRSGRRSLALALVTSSIVASGCSILPGARWKVDVINGDAPLLISITTDAASRAWYVPANGRMVLLDEAQGPAEGVIELIDPAQGCLVHDKAALPRDSFTIRPVAAPADPAGFDLRLEAGASLASPVNVDYFGGCSG
jgi:hypothetical protein